MFKLISQQYIKGWIKTSDRKTLIIKCPIVTFFCDNDKSRRSIILTCFSLTELSSREEHRTRGFVWWCRMSTITLSRKAKTSPKMDARHKSRLFGGSDAQTLYLNEFKNYKVMQLKCKWAQWIIIWYMKRPCQNRATHHQDRRPVNYCPAGRGRRQRADWMEAYRHGRKENWQTVNYISFSLLWG